MRLSFPVRTATLYRGRYLPHALHVQRGSAADEPESPATPVHEEIVVVNPANGEKLSSVVSASPDDVERTVQDAQRIFASGVWSRAPPIARSKILSRIARALEDRISDFAQIETMQTGRTIREMNAQLSRLPEWLDYYAALLRTKEAYVAPTQGNLLNYVQRVPLGVIAQITPFNHPLLIALKKIAPALAAGNSVIIKPSELTPITLLEFAELATKAGLPDGVLSVLPGYGASTGKDLVSHPLIRKVDLTAGTSTGRTIGSIVGGNLASFTAELGGKAPILVFSDADVQNAVNGATFAAFIASGQTCVSGTRLIIQDKVYDEFMARFLEKVESIRRRMGNPMNPRSAMGTIISQRHLDRIDSFVQAHRSHGTLLAGGSRLLGLSPLDGFDYSRGAFYPPTVFADVNVDSPLWQEEIFGPVVVVRRFSDEKEGVGLANDCKYGLGAALWTADLSRAHRVAAQIEAGLVWVNTHHRNDPSSPWGGMKESGVGRENGVEAFHAYTQSKSTIVNIASAEESRTDDWFGEEASEVRYG